MCGFSEGVVYPASAANSSIGYRTKHQPRRVTMCTVLVLQTLFVIFIEFVIDAAEGKPNNSSAGHIIGKIVKQMLWLAVGVSHTSQPLSRNSG